jgi:ABC-type nitrate/sulfonate/bicarbonate transport system permease component
MGEYVNAAYASPVTMHRLLPLVLVGAALLAWEAASRSGLWSPLLFPSLAKIFDQLV